MWDQILTIRAPLCAGGTVPGPLAGASLLHDMPISPVSMSMCQREVGDPLPTFPFGMPYMPQNSGRAGHLQENMKMPL